MHFLTVNRIMRFTAGEMEIICVFYGGTIKETASRLKEAIPRFTEQARIEDAVNALNKLTEMEPGDLAVLSFN